MPFFSSVQPPVQSQNKSSRGKREKIIFTEDVINEECRRTVSAGKIKKYLKQMNQHQSRFISNPSIPPGSAAAKYANNFIPSQHGNKRLKPLGKTVKVELHVNYKGSIVPQVNVNVKDPLQIQVTVLWGPNQSAASGSQSNGAGGSRSVDTHVAPDQAGENVDNEPKTTST